MRQYRCDHDVKFPIVRHVSLPKELVKLTIYFCRKCRGQIKYLEQVA